MISILVFYCRVYELEESDSELDERLVGNPIYGDSLPGRESENISGDRESYDVLHHNVGTVQGVVPTGIYEAISNLPMASSSQPNRASDRDIEKHQMDDASLYAELGTEGAHVSENANEGMKVGSRVNDNELRSPYAIIN